MNKKAQVGETISWIFATIIIIVIMLIALWMSFLISKTKVISVANVNSDLGKDSILSGKTLIAEEINNQNNQIIENAIKQGGT